MMCVNQRRSIAVESVWHTVLRGDVERREGASRARQASFRHRRWASDATSSIAQIVSRLTRIVQKYS